MVQRTRTTGGRRRRRAGARAGGTAGPDGAARGTLTARVEAAVASSQAGRPPAAGLVEALAREPVEVVAGAEAADPLDRALRGVLVAAVAGAWQRGWQPADLHRAVGRAHGRPAARLLLRAVAAEAARHAEGSVPPRWRQQLDALGADRPAAGEAWAVPWQPPSSTSAGPSVARVQAVGVAVATVARVRELPRLPRLGPVPGEAPLPHGDRPRADAAVLRKVTSLLAKAESTTFIDEAEALTAKAQQLMTRYAIDRALLEAGQAGETVAGGRRIPIDDPYANARYLLLAAVAAANRCRAVLTKAWGFSTVFGDEDDLDAVEMLFTSLLVQATRAMVLEPPVARGNGGRTRSFRHAFLVAFAGRIGERLADAAEAATADAATADPARHGTAIVPLFAARRAAADRALGEAFPETMAMRVSARDLAGWQAGVRAADRAQIGVERPVGGASRALDGSGGDGSGHRGGTRRP